MDFSYCLTKDVELPVSIRIATLEGKYQLESSESHLPDIYVTVQLFGDNKPLTVPIKTSYKAFRNHWSWNEWLTLPIRYCDLPASAQLAITAWDAQGPRKTKPIGGTTFRLFGKQCTLRKGKHKLHLWRDCEADGSHDTTTPSKAKHDHDQDMNKLEKLVKRYDCGDIRPEEWLDVMAFRHIETIHKQLSAESTDLALYVDLPKFDFPVVYGEMEYNLFSPFSLAGQQLNETAMTTAMGQAIHPSAVQRQAISTTDSSVANSNPFDSNIQRTSTHYALVLDADLQRDNPVEAKHRRLVRSHRNGPLDRDLKPNPKIRDELNSIMSYPPTQTLTPEEKDLVWKFRFYLTREKRALTKFLKCVVWTDSIEVRQAVDLLPLWADINVDDALELLGKDFENKAVRSYAVNQLRKADDDDLLLYLLQLVQALKFEYIEDKETEFDHSSLSQFLIDRAIRNDVLGTYFYWYLMVELQDLQNSVNRKLYARVGYRYFQDLLQIPNGQKRRLTLRNQGYLTEVLSQLAAEISNMKESRQKKIDYFRSKLSDSKKPILKVNPLPLILDPSKDIVGIDPAKSTIFNSSLAPLKICFLCTDGTEYPIIFKYGDDLRQDQLVIQIISLMDKLLLKENLDLKLTPYKVMATGSDQGMMQFIPSQSLAAVLNDHQNNVLSFFRQHHPSDIPGSVYGIDPKVMETYTRSCGVGDRHLDNLLLSPDGHLFHVDFGFILGRDPKPFPPPMKLCKEMIEAMGGANSPHYAQFQQYCYTAFTTLRRNANLILNLFSLMVDANITDIKNEPEKAVMKVQEKFRLDLTEEAAIAYFRGLISESVNALFPQIMETVHKWAQYWRR
ncbi:Phosphatidylinositol 3-kinase catalytic subunit type 3 [Choanephora cucurbitarum]|uniref:Phosphatidylinositol 3-kinase VPS34 n=1 Tax=Choanephora cucurbitarum TaxID=101091 RepID=A0A1C7NAY0_9FUNG|nr:Phosphatidylinositol 3-kinase catalytic subunit type 3 [Choanephora cucurbitarum]